MTKICTKCNVEFPATLEWFYKDRKWLMAYCKICHNSIGKTHREANSEKLKENRKKYYKVNKEKMNAATKAWKLANPEQGRKASIAWQKANPDRVKVNAKKWNLKQRGFTSELQDLMLEAQENLCALCGTDTPAGRHNAWNSDHDHNTGKARGMLCNSCNITLGHIESKSPDWMDKARKYIDNGGFYTASSQEIVIQPLPK